MLDMHTPLSLPHMPGSAEVHSVYLLTSMKTVIPLHVRW